MSNSAFIEAVDVWSFRGNRVFGGPGSWGQASMPPSPSVLSGALRSAILVRDAVDLRLFAANQARHPQIGTRDEPGSWQLQDAFPALRSSDGRIEPLYPRPADIVPYPSTQNPRELQAVGHMRAIELPRSVLASCSLPLTPVLAESERSKPATHRWLTREGMQRWLAGLDVLPHQIVGDDRLWLHEERVGVALNHATGAADDKKLFTVQMVACRPNVGLAVRVRDVSLTNTVLRFGGDGRGAVVVPQSIDWAQPDYEAIARSGRARLYLSSPGIFPLGWLPHGSGQPDPKYGASFELHGVRARIVAAAVARPQVISGFDVARGVPKLAQRVVPAGAVYWLDELKATPQALSQLVDEGLWPQHVQDRFEDAQRRAEGYNRCLVAAWHGAGELPHPM